MKRVLITWGSFSLVVITILFLGCTNRTTQTSNPSIVNSPSSSENKALSADRTFLLATSTAHFSTLEKAYQSYKAAYENYVRMLRESGPQTIDTLNALADYQKKYQIYQMLLNAEKEIHNVASSVSVSP